MIQFARVRTSEKASPNDPVVAAYGLSFPGDPGASRRPAKLVQYVVNPIWWEQNYNNNVDDEPEEDYA
jgi:hypothetical protein